MRIGLDVGGTHTDAVLIGDKGIIATAKVVTDHELLLNSVLSALKEVIRGADQKSIEAVTLSTTLTTNALLEGKADRVGVIVSSGPGIDPHHFRIGDAYFVIDGSIDHRGIEKKALDNKQLDHAVRACREKSIRAYAVATKFSTRNSTHELLMEAGIGGEADVITAGHRLSGGLNFPRRITTAYFNSAISRQFNDFALAIKNGIEKLGLNAPVNVLKADGGTMPLASSRIAPVQSILSGPAASIMGIAALCFITRDALILDIGGTSTDIAIFAKGLPLLEQEGISLRGNPTLVRSLKTMSLAVGGDSTLRVFEGHLSVGPDRSGPSLAAGGTRPALIDALNATGEAAFGDTDASRRGIADLAQTAGTTPNILSNDAIGIAVKAITDAVGHMIHEINERPVYTIHDFLHSERIAPSQLYIVGGPAQAFADRLSKSFGIKTIVPRLHAVANAIGAAITRTTADLELFADTERQVLLVPRLSVQKSITTTYSLEHARRDAEGYLRSSLGDSVVSAQDTEIQIIEASSFNMIDGSRMMGRNIRVRSQTKPGHITSYLAGVRSSC